MNRSIAKRLSPSPSSRSAPKRGFPVGIAKCGTSSIGLSDQGFLHRGLAPLNRLKFTRSKFTRLATIACLTTTLIVAFGSPTQADEAPEQESAPPIERLADDLEAADDGDALRQRASWQAYDAGTMAEMLRSSLDELGIVKSDVEIVTAKFLSRLQQPDTDPLDDYVQVLSEIVPVVDNLVAQSATSLPSVGKDVDPNAPTYGDLESLPSTMRMTVRTWLGRELVRARLYDEALPAIAEVDATESIDPAAVLFYRGACYHALLMKDEALHDLRRLLENERAAPRRFARTARLMVADIKPLKEDSLDEISRLMTDVTRRLELGRANEKVQDQEQKVIDKLTKLIEEIEKQQQQQQQQQQSAGGQGSGQGGQGSPMDDSRIAGGSGSGDIDRKKIEDRPGWGNLPPAERQQAIQQIGRDLPTHYREAIEAYFRKLATDGNP